MRETGHNRLAICWIGRASLEKFVAPYSVRVLLRMEAIMSKAHDARKTEKKVATKRWPRRSGQSVRWNRWVLKWA
jgi:hypothetical protein